MTDRVFINQKVRLTLEASEGTNPGSGFQPLLALKGTYGTDGEVKYYRGVGHKYDAVAVANTEWTTLKLDGQPTYSELTYLLNAIFCKVTPTSGVASVTITGGGASYETPPTVAFTGGGGTGAAGTAVLTADAVTSVTITNPGTGYTSAPTVVFSEGGGADAAGTAVLSSYKTWTFTPSDSSTDTLATYSLEAGETGEVEKAVNLFATDWDLKADRAGDITTSMSFLGKRLDVTAANTFGTLAATGLTMVPLMAPHLNVYLDTTSGGIGGTQLTRAFVTSLKMGKRQDSIWAFNRTNTSFSARGEDEPTFEGTLMVMARNDASQGGKVLFPTMRAGTKMYLRLDWTSDTAIQTVATVPHYNQFTFDACIALGNPKEFKKQGVAFAMEWPFRVMYDAGWSTGRAYQAVLVNDLASL